MDAIVLCFLVENYDHYAKATRQYQLMYHEMRNGQQNEVELVNPQSGARFIAKHRTPVLLEQLLLGSCVNIQGRNFTVLSYLDEKTKQELGRRHEGVVVVLPPEAMRMMGKLIDVAVRSNNFRMGRMKTMRLTKASAQAYGRLIGLDSMDMMALERPGVTAVVEFKCEDANRKWGQMYGKLRSVVRPAFACPKERVNDATEFFFGPSQRPDVSQSSADVMGNPGPMSLCLLKPHTIEQGNAGAILDMIASASTGGRPSFDIVACDKVDLSKPDAAEFYECYRFLPNFSDHVTHLASGPSLALCVRGDNVTARLREFVGPFDVVVAKHLSSNSIRAKYGYNRVRNAVHVTDMPEDGLLECNFFFNTLRQ